MGNRAPRKGSPILPHHHALKWKIRSALNRAGLWSLAQKSRAGVCFALKIAHEPDFGFFSHFEGEEGLFVDIGANAGQSALSFRIHNHSFRILSFEPNAFHEPDLQWTRRLLGSAFEFKMLGIGRKTEVLTIYVPTVDGVLFTQEATFVPEQLQDPITKGRIADPSGQENFEITEAKFEIRALDEFGLDPTIIKIDVQGFELEAIEGMRQTLLRSRPMLLIEQGPNSPQVTGALGSLGYAPFTYELMAQKLRPFHPGLSCLNIFYVHASKHPELEKKRLF